MSATIPFTEDKIRPLCIKGNDTAENPVEFEISPVGGAAKARLKSMIHATSGLAELGEWTESVQKSIISAFETGAAVFAEGVTSVRGLHVKVGLALKVGILQELPKGLDRTSDFAITTGWQFSRVCGYWPVLSFEVAMAIAKISGQAEIDPRFFDWLSTSLGMPKTRPGTAGRVPATPDASAIAGSRTKPGSRRRSTSGPSPSS